MYMRGLFGRQMFRNATAQIPAKIRIASPNPINIPGMNARQPRELWRIAQNTKAMNETEIAEIIHPAF